MFGTTFVAWPRFLAAALFAAVAFFFVVHRAILMRLLAALLLRCEGSGTNHGREDRHQDCRRRFHLN